MSISLLTLEFRGDRRIRLFFSGSLAAGAFTSTALYSITSADGLGANPTNVEAVYAVANTPAAVELSADVPLALGGLYTIGCTNVPAADSSTFTGTTQGTTALPLQNPPNVEPATTDLDLLLYGRDLVHNGQDFVEDASGDLANITGRGNWLGAVWRRMMSYGLPWDPTYSPRADEYVNAPDVLKLPLAGRMVAQARADDRTAQATCTVTQSSTDPNSWAFVLIVSGTDGLDPETLELPQDIASP